MSLQLNLYSDNAPVPSRMLALVKLLIKKEHLPRKHAFHYVHPTFVNPKEKSIQSLETLKESEQFKEVVGAAIECGLITTSGLNEELCFNPIIDGHLLQLKNIDRTFPIVMANLALQSKIGDERNLFADICAWILHQSVMESPQDKGAWKSLLNKQNPSLYEKAGLKNDAAWDMVVYWMIYLGLAARTEHIGIQGFYPDPTVFFDNHIKMIFGDDNELHIKEFISRMGKICPVLDGGSVFESNDYQNKPGDVISDGVSFAFERLRYRRIIDFHCPNDERDFYRLFNDEKIAFISLKKGR